MASIVALPLMGCQEETAKVRYRVIATVEVDGKPIEASTVMEVRYARVKNSLIGTGGATRLYGEALIFDLPGGKSFYMLPTERIENGPIAQIWEYAVLNSFGIKNSIGGLEAADFQILRSTSGRIPYSLGKRFPTFVAFEDDQKPNTIFEFRRDEIGAIFPNVCFVRLELEVTSAPITERLRERLPWLNSPQQVFDREPPGSKRPTGDRPIGHLVTIEDFFGDGSR
ncbi:hypothetical protein ACIQUB_09715 [Rhizobium sp. NPDC090275]|uniref:hypothetical protein n=1 Tax=Rhizobium sp. NPDC090275 TaxID=3364498 RepID=UPI00383B7880